MRRLLLRHPPAIQKIRTRWSTPTTGELYVRPRPNNNGTTTTTLQHLHHPREKRRGEERREEERRGKKNSCFFFQASASMKKLCPNLDREDGLDTVLEVPIPEEMFEPDRSPKSGGAGCVNMKAWMRPHGTDRQAGGMGGAELQLMLGVVGAPLIPLPLRQHNESPKSGWIKNDCIEVSMARYIVQQYIAACGGETALNSVHSMYAMGKVRMAASDFRTANNVGKKGTPKFGAGAGAGAGGGEVGGFVLWQKKPELWCLELVVAGCKISAGNDGKVAWRQTPWQPSHASRGPPRPLRRSLQGLDPQSTANLFSNAVCVGEKTINGDDCFVLRLDAESPALLARSSTNVEIIRHTVWGCFSTRTGLLAQLEDSHLLRIKSSEESECIYWETIMESSIEDYRTIDGINIAHAGRTAVSLFRFGDTTQGHTRTRMEEVWTVEEVDFNIWGLSTDCFLPPRDLKEELPLSEEGCKGMLRNKHPSTTIRAQAAAVVKIGKP